jgi:hypothetical protein
MTEHIKDDPNLPDGVGINTETGEFVSLSETSGQVAMADGGAVPQRVIEMQYPGRNAYTDIETVAFKHEATSSITSATADDNELFEEILDFSELLDRREEMADLLHLDMQYSAFQVEPTNESDDISCGLAAAQVFANEASEAPFTNLIDDNNDPGTVDEIEVNDGADVLTPELSVGVNLGYKDQTNGAGGPGTADNISYELPGWKTTDPSFEERDVISVSQGFSHEREGTIKGQCTGIMTFGIYEVQTTEVVHSP